MKALLLLGLLISLAATAPAQSIPHWGDNSVLVQTPDSAAPALRKLAQAFAAQGFLVEKLDAQLGTLRLAPHAAVAALDNLITVRATATAGANSLLSLRADYQPRSGTALPLSPVEYVGSSAGFHKLAFGALQQGALRYPGGQVSYGRR